jgi:hypothetical protein
MSEAGTPKEASSTAVADGNAGENKEAIPGKKAPGEETSENNGQNGHHSRRDKGLERVFKMHTKFAAEQTATNKLILETLQGLKGGLASNADKKPDIKDFEKPEEFATAIEEWSGREVERKAAAPKAPEKKAPAGEEPTELSDEQRVQVLSQKFGVDEEIAEAFVEAQAEASDRIPDFEEVVSDQKIPSSRTLSRLIIELGDADLQYHLSKRENRVITLELSKLKRSGDVLEKLKEIQAEIGENKGEGEEGARKGDPEAPITPVGSAKAPSRKSPAAQSADEYFAQRQAQVNKEKRLF